MLRARRALAVLAMMAGVLLAWAGSAAAESPLLPVAGSPFADVGSPQGVAFSPSGGLLAAANVRGASVGVFSVSAGGALTPVAGSPFATGTGPSAVAFSPSGRLVATTNSSIGTVSVYAVGAGGALTAVPGSPFAAGSRPYALSFNPSGNLLAVVDQAAVRVFSVAADGVLTLVPGSPFATGPTPSSVAFSPSGSLLAVGNASYTAGTISMYSVAPGGGLTEVSGSPFATGRQPTTVIFSPNGQLLTNTNGSDGTVAAFSVSPGGALSPAPGGFATPGGNPQGSAIDASGSLLAVSNASLGNYVSLLSLAGDGALAILPGSPFAAGGYTPYGMAFSSTGLLAVANLNGDSIGIFGPPGRLAIQKRADALEVAPGDELTYTVKITNPGTSDASGPVADDLSGVLDQASYLGNASASVGTVTVDEQARQATWHGTLGPGESATISYSVRVADDAQGLLFNGVNGPVGSSCPADVACLVETPVVTPVPPQPTPQADLAIAKTASIDAAHPGDQVVYALTVTNHGPDDATGVTVQDPVPAGAYLLGARPSQGTCRQDDDQLACDLGRLPRGGSALVLVQARIAASANGAVVNEAGVFGDLPDPVPANDTARATVDVTPRPGPAPPEPPTPTPGPAPTPAPARPVANLTVAKRVERAVVRRGGPSTYRVTVTNRGPATATDVRVLDASLRPAQLVSVRTNRGRCARSRSGAIRCTIGSLASGARATITIRTRQTVVGRQVNAVAVLGAGWDPELRRNVAVAASRVLPARTRRPAVTG